jgi:general secretion pathway protein N
MKEWFAYGAVFLSAYLFFVVVTLPAKVVLGYVTLPKNVVLQGVSGSVWQTKITEVSYKKVSLHQVTASLNFWSLFTLDPTLKVNFGDALLAGPEGILTVSGLLAQLTITHGEVLISANDIAQQLTLPIPLIAAGNVKIKLDEFILGKPICQQALGRIAWHKAGVTAFDQRIALGTISADMSCQQGALALAIDPKNNLGLTFTAYVRSKGASGTGFLKPGKKFPATLQSVLPFLGKADNQGRYRLNF